MYGISLSVAEYDEASAGKCLLDALLKYCRRFAYLFPAPVFLVPMSLSGGQRTSYEAAYDIN